MQALTLNANLPALQLPADILAKVQAQFAEAAANTTHSINRLSFGGKMFNLSANGIDIELQERMLDVYMVAVDPNFHYQFYEKSYDDSKDLDDKGRFLARYPNETDEFEFTPNAEFAQRAYKQRAIVMLANDPEHKLYAVDFGYNSIKKTGNLAMGLLNLSQLINQFHEVMKTNPQVMPFMLKVQMSFTKEVQPEVQFSLFDQRVQGEKSYRIADMPAINAMIEALTNGSVDEMLKVEFDSKAGSNPTPVAKPVAQASVAKAVTQAPVAKKETLPVAKAPEVPPQDTAELAEL